jgi:hypothetical protein
MLILALAGASPSLYGQDQKAEIQKRLSSAFKRTTLTADRSDVAKAGTVLTLHKDNLLMCSMDAHASPTNTYKNGAISMGLGATMSWSMALSSVGQQVASLPQRVVGGDKIWLADFQVKEDGVYFLFYSDPFDNVRYFGQLKFPVSKGAFPPADNMMKTIAEVVTDDSASQEAAPADSAAPPAQTSGEQAPAPATATKTIALGQTMDEVCWRFLGRHKRSIWVLRNLLYPDMKVIFISGKVADVQ